MFIKITKRDNKTCVLKLGNRIIKIPYSAGSRREVSAERKRLREAGADSHFSDYLLAYKYIFGCPATSCLSPVIGDDHLIEEYFHRAFADSASWKPEKIKFLLPADVFLLFVLKYVPGKRRCLEEFLNAFKMPCSSAHGDFNRDNILSAGHKLYFIDWSRYSFRSSRYFDLIDFYIYDKKIDQGGSWIEVWRQECEKHNGEIFGIRFPREYFFGYGIWKAAQELKALAFLKLDNRYKQKKYINFINIIVGFIEKKLCQ